MNDFEGVARVLGLALMVAGVAAAGLAIWTLATGRRPIWLARRQSLTDAYVRWWAASSLLSGLGGIAIGGPYVIGYPVHGGGLLVQAAGFALMLGAAVCWGFIITRSGYRTP